MRKIEITTKVENSLQEIDNILKSKGFKLIRTSVVNDIYMKRNNIVANKKNALKLVKNSVVLRYLNENGKEFKKITYKDKKYNREKILSEININVEIDDINKAYNIFCILGFDKLVDVNYRVYVYELNGLELAFQEVDNLGLLLEVENNNDYTDACESLINKEKQHMLNEIKSLGIKTTEDFNVKKAYELIIRD